ncbi:Na+/H+ antiporter NhaC family protein [Alginatibacterium sediminis]|uniref:Na+/H+ antiporter NhaC family protein n=1 Tax=Alginatibacterium sediminis TaxID=2164068 RepID=A0A420EDS4_9ALTE|nr:Na+/H+ antiporter NhaC family protein [Alginatibacterium sediminis]RKF18818.1 Na+/H+ antiporter NhaC family protein [Alginatibacterium sediminis]
MSHHRNLEIKASALALLPLLVFLSLFVGVGTILHLQKVEFAFYQLPAPIAILPAIVLALYLSKERLNDAIEQFLKGMGNSNIMTMCLIYLLAGAFSAVSSASGGVDVVVNLALHAVPSWFLLPGFFIVSGLIATAMGTSMGTIAAVAPIALGLAQSAGIEPVYMAGAVLGGAMFGDNLSIISDTTIAATRTQGCDMKDKFRQNVFIALPAALVTILLLFALGQSTPIATAPIENWYNALPYLAILILALSGMNVFVVLFSGTLLAGAFAGLSMDYSALQWGKDIYQGFSNMQEIFLLSLFVGGLSELMRRQGGLAFIQAWVGNKVNKARNPSRAAQFGIALITGLTNIGVANNTVAILVSGDLTRQMATDYKIQPARSASLMDIFACVVQGLIPYGAQALLLGSLFSLSPVQVISASWYPMILALLAIYSIYRKS